jgi:hypothetical protein
VSHFITIDGDTMTLTEWAQLYGISHHLILERLSRGWDEEHAVTKPARKYNMTVSRIVRALKNTDVISRDEEDQEPGQ